ncbi:unnamed protein product [Pseudo-nitzschia multistriata]|uniref:Sialate O-acetylesterase domain-containing protein n=1 Tax=Pseudo-nitzschia multistriata TaxID=183589 RepID=A0A448ZPJ4_9STRA|nr:unnamed protein product [Pseudo-nitzschia multistriata]
MKVSGDRRKWTTLLAAAAAWSRLPVADASGSTAENAAPVPTLLRTARRDTPPLQIYVLVGQSNMQGHGYVDAREEDGASFRNGTLEWMVETYPSAYGRLKNKDGTAWAVRDDVYVAYNRQDGGTVRPEWSTSHGFLTAGFGGDPGQEGHQMGPELGFGWAVGDHHSSERSEHQAGARASPPAVLLLKVAWGGKSLAVDFRPPSSGGTTGLYYEAVLATVWRALGSLEGVIPGQWPGRTYELAGFAWHQGWNDGCNKTMAAEYESNLANLVRDVRADLGVPDLPFVVGVSGMNGWKNRTQTQTQIQTQMQTRTQAEALVDGQLAVVIDAQLAVGNPSVYPEFAGTVESVETRGFFREPRPASPGDQVYHWNNNCESYWKVGAAMGEAMIGLLRTKPKHGLLPRHQAKQVHELLSR